MGIVLDKSKPLLLGSYGQKKKLGHNSAIFVLEQNSRIAKEKKMGKMIGSLKFFFYPFTATIKTKNKKSPTKLTTPKKC